MRLSRFPAVAGRPLRERLLIGLSIIGPGIVAAGAGNDAGGISTYSVVGARFGYSLLWMLAMITVLFILTQEMGARMGAVTGKGLGALIRERFGIRSTAFAMLTMLVANLATTVAEFAGIAAGLHLFGVSKTVSIPVAALAVWVLVTQWDFRKVEKVFLLISVVSLAYVASGLLTRPDWGDVTRGLVPTFSLEPSYLAAFVATVGTTITPWGQFFVQAYVADKGVGMSDYRFTRLDVIVGVLASNVVSFFIIIACAATLHVRGIPVEGAADAAKALEPLAGSFAATLFGLGLVNASLLGASILPMSTSYAVCEAFGWEAGIDRRWRDAGHFYSIFTFVIAGGALLALLPAVPLFTIVLVAQVVNGVLLPVILVYVALIARDRSLMGEHANPSWLNAAAWAANVLLIGLSTVLVMSAVLRGLGALA